MAYVILYFSMMYKCLVYSVVEKVNFNSIA